MDLQILSSVFSREHATIDQDVIQLGMGRGGGAVSRRSYYMAKPKGNSGSWLKTTKEGNTCQRIVFLIEHASLVVQLAKSSFFIFIQKKPGRTLCVSFLVLYQTQQPNPEGIGLGYFFCVYSSSCTVGRQWRRHRFHRNGRLCLCQGDPARFPLWPISRLWSPLTGRPRSQQFTASNHSRFAIYIDRIISISLSSLHSIGHRKILDNKDS